MLRDEKGCKLRVIPCDDRGVLLVDEYRKLLNVALGCRRHARVQRPGHRQPIKEMIEMAHARGVRCWWTARRPRRI